MDYKIIKIKKKNNKYRTIYVPDLFLKKRLKKTNRRYLNKLVRQYDSKVAHGFIKKRSPITNALEHCGYKYTTCMDIENFFDSIELKHFENYVNKFINLHLSATLIDGHPRQGLPTSPNLANLATFSMDKAIVKQLQKISSEIKYTRYADDLALSYNDLSLRDRIVNKIIEIVEEFGFNINQSKTRTMVGRRIITGIGVDDKIHPTRRIKRKLRAAKHKNNQPQIRGLEEFIKLKH